jgi:hypothetical protein
MALFMPQPALSEPGKSDSLLAGWTLTTGLSQSESNRKASGAPSDTDTWGGFLVASKRYDDLTFFGGSVSFNRARTSTSADSGTTHSDIASGSVFALRRIEPTLLVDVNLAYGAVDLDNDHLSTGTAVSYSADAAFWSAGMGITKLFQIDATFRASLNGRYSFVYSDAGDFTDSSNETTPGGSQAKSTLTLGGGLSARYGKFEPSVNLGYNRSNRTLFNDTDDKDYFTYAVGAGYAFDKEMRLQTSFNSSIGKSLTHEHSISVSLSRSF